MGVGDGDWQVGVGGDWCGGVDEAGEADEVVWFDEPVEVGSVGVGFVVVAGPDQAGSAVEGEQVSTAVIRAVSARVWTDSLSPDP